MKLKIDFTMYSLTLGWALNLVFVISFYWMLFVFQEPKATFVANNFAEFWIEFFGLQFILIFISISIVIEMKKYTKRLKEKLKNEIR